MLSIRRSLRFHSAARMLPHATNLLPSSAITWMSFSSSSLRLEALTVSSRSLSQISSHELLDAAKEQQKRKFFGPKKSKKPIQDAAKQSKNFTRLQANPDDADLALEVFAAIQSANGSGLSMDVAPMLMTTFINNNKLDKALQVLEFSNKQKVSLRLSPYEKLMAAFYKTKNYDTALKVFEMVRSVKLTPSKMMYTTALLSAHKSKQSELVPKILEQMLKDAKPNESRAFQVALSAAVNSRQHELVLTLMECSKAFDAVLTSEHYHFVLKSYATVGDVQAALGTRDTLQKNGFDLTEYGMRWLVHCACKADQWDLVKELLSAPIADQ